MPPGSFAALVRGADGSVVPAVQSRSRRQPVTRLGGLLRAPPPARVPVADEDDEALGPGLVSLFGRRAHPFGLVHEYLAGIKN